MSNGHKTNVQGLMYLKYKEKERYKNSHYIPHIHTPPITKSPILTLPL